MNDNLIADVTINGIRLTDVQTFAVCISINAIFNELQNNSNNKERFFKTELYSDVSRVLQSVNEIINRSRTFDLSRE